MPHDVHHVSKNAMNNWNLVPYLHWLRSYTLIILRASKQVLDFTLWWLWAGCYVILALNKKGYNECTFLGHIYFVFPFSQAKLPVSNAAICCKIEWDNRNYPWLIETSPHSMFTLCCFAPPAIPCSDRFSSTATHFRPLLRPSHGLHVTLTTLQSKRKM